MVDNCYGEFLDTKEPVAAGADIMAGSLMNNPGGGIAMGGGTDGLKKAADYITAPLFEDGVYKACAHFGLL